MPDSEESDELPKLSFAQFLESTPPNQAIRVPELGAYPGPRLVTPQLQLHCSSEHCNGTRFFGYKGSEVVLPHGKLKSSFLTYTCRNCNETNKHYAVRLSLDDVGLDGYAVKLGELPPFGPPTSSRLISLIGPDRDLFLKGRRAENLGLGIGAFTYYRRVVENQKSRLIEQIIRVAEKLQTSDSSLTLLRQAVAENQFSKAVDMVKDAIPQTLRIDGHNPLTLLHSALSEGIHDRSDEDCLELAATIRIVLDELAERVAVALKDHAELKSAVARLVSRKSSIPTKTADTGESAT